MRQSALVSLFAFVVLVGTAAAQEPALPETVDFVEHIQPILKSRCYECHGPDEQDGDVRLDLRSAVFGADEDLWVVIPGEADDSSLYERITLPADDPDVMPAEGDPLSKTQIALVRRWIEQGAKWPESADAAARAADARAKESRLVLPALPEDQETARRAALEQLQKVGALAMPISNETIASEVNFSLLGPAVTDEHVAQLAGLEPALVWLNLSRTNVTDAGLAPLKDFAQLRRLNLAQTGVGDAALRHLANLAELEYLNLYGTKVTDAGLDALRGLTNLRKLYLWQTGATEAGTARLREALPDLNVDLGGYAEVIAKVAEEVAAKKAAAKVFNDVCPVSGEAVDPAITTEHDGKTVGFCCKKCLASFTKDPAKFAAKIVAKGAAAAGGDAKKPVNDVCPVSGKPVDPAITAEHDGKLVALCCNKCLAAFKKDPAKFAAKLAK